MKDATETWMPVVQPGFENVYSVSSYGRVRRDAPGRGAVSGFVLKPKRARKYLQVLLRNARGNCKYAYVHHLVLKAFAGPPPGALGTKRTDWQAHHKDNNPHNNHADNLQWIRASENRRMAISPCGESHYHSVMKADDVRLIIDDLLVPYRPGLLAEIAGKHGVVYGFVRAVNAGELWRHLIPDGANIPLVQVPKNYRAMCRDRRRSRRNATNGLAGTTPTPQHSFPQATGSHL